MSICVPVATNRAADDAIVVINGKEQYVFDNICLKEHYVKAAWEVDFDGEFVAEYEGLPEGVQDELLACVGLLERFGPMLGRPRVDTLNGSRHANMKELRFSRCGGAWRFAFAFDPLRRAIVLCGGDKSGGGEKRFYLQLISRADARFEAHLAALTRPEHTGRKR